MSQPDLPALASSRKPPERASPLPRRRARLAFPTPLRDDSAGRDRNPARSAAAAVAKTTTLQDLAGFTGQVGRH
jgi:hypothetical protein